MDNKLHYAHTFFCSHLAAVGRASEVQAADKRWQAEKPLTREAYERLSSIYYESFIDSLMQVDGQTSGAVYADTAHLTLETDRLCTLRHPKLPAAEYAFRLCRFHLFFFPYDICLFAMEIAEEPETTLDTLIAAHGILRETSCYEIAEQGILKSQIDAPEYLALLEEILRLCPPRPSAESPRQGRFSGLTLTGNKLKCFQIFILDDFSDELLFELGTLSPVGCVADHKHEYSPSQEYYDRIIRTHTISAFRNWKALALVDSFTVVAKGRTAAQMWVWPNSYFRLIYIHALYQKTLLFVVNRQFRSAANDRKSIRLLHKMKELEHWYAFSNISYNFLPQLIYRAIDTGLDIATEREQLHRHLEQEAERLEKNSERRLAGLILFLTMLTVCSATYDGASLVKDYFGWESGTTPFRIFAALLLSAIVITSISVWHYRRNKS